MTLLPARKGFCFTYLLITPSTYKTFNIRQIKAVKLIVIIKHNMKVGWNAAHILVQAALHLVQYKQ